VSEREAQRHEFLGFLSMRARLNTDDANQHNDDYDAVSSTEPAGVGVNQAQGERMGDPVNKILVGGAGSTDSERFLFAQCRRSYLQLWSYANLFRNQGKLGDGDGKELCDVMVVLGNSIVLFSDKNCAFPDSGNLELDWQRWEKRAISASRKQLRGAERWIRQFPNQVFLDRRCTCPLPIKLPAGENLRVYKVAVALGASDRFRRETGGSGSLMLDAHPSGDYRKPFVANLFDADGDVVHIVDEITLPVLLDELDTLPDLLEYLEAKERLVRRGSVIGLAGEEEMIGYSLDFGPGSPISKCPMGTN
jgi:hypothetical protein